MKNKIELPLLEDYLDKKLSLDQIKQIESLLATDLELAEELQALMLVREAIKMEGWKSQIAKTQQEFLDNRKIRSIDSAPSQKSSSSWYLRIAASISILLIGLAAILIFSTSSESIDQNFLSYQVPVMRSNATTEDAIKEAYQSENYQGVIGIAEQSKSLNVDDQFLLGMAYLELGMGKEAVKELQNIQKHNATRNEKMYVAETDYYLLRAFLLSGDYEKAKSQIEIIRSNPKHKYHRNVDRWDVLKIKILDIKN